MSTALSPQFDEPIDAEFTTIQQKDDAEYDALVAKLEAKFPPVSGEGFDFSKMKGNLKGRTAKAIVLQLSCQGWSVAEIAEAIGASACAVGQYLASAIREASPLDDVEILREFELRKLDVQEKACWEQFERSCEDAITEKEGSTDKGSFTSTERKGQSGNPAYIRALLAIGQRRAALVGMDKPTKVHVDKTERKLQVTEVVVTNREEVAAARAAGLLK